MSNADSLHPTLWRTCRVLANRPRLRILKLLFERPGLSVSGVAESLDMPLALVSLYLRALNARGLLAAQRKGRFVLYRPKAEGDVKQTGPLVEALRHTFRAERDPVERIFRLATAFTHPRRPDIVRALREEPMTVEPLRKVTKIPRQSLERHLSKLEARGFVCVQDECWRCVAHPDRLGRTLADLT